MEHTDFTNMSVWQKSVDLLLKIYQITKHFPSDERFGLTSDMRRAVNSISHNIAEGFGRYEIMSQSIVAHKLGYIKEKNILDETSMKNHL
jgi:hypothetical protein